MKYKSIYDRIGKPLPNRNNVVLSRNLNLHYDNVLVINDLFEYLNKQNEEIFVIGGKQVYELTLLKYHMISLIKSTLLLMVI